MINLRDFLRVQCLAATFCAASLLLPGCHRGADAPSGDDSDTTAPALVMVDTTTATPTAIEDSVEVTGSLAPMPGSETKVGPPAPGRIRSVYVQNGQFVTQGQVIAQLDTGPLLGQQQSADAAVRGAQAALQQARAGYNTSVATNAAAERAAETNLASARVALDKLLAGPRPEDVQKAEADVAAARAAEASARTNVDRQQRLFTAGIVARKDVEAAQLQLTTAGATLRSAVEELALRRAPNRPQDIAAARLAVQSASDALQSARAQSSSNQVKAGDVAVAQQQLAAALGAQAAARAQFSMQVIRAPISGVVAMRSANAGEYLDASGSICTIVSLRQVRLLLQAPPDQAAKIRVGMPINFTTDAQPNKLRTGRVTLAAGAVNPASNTVTIEGVANNSDGSLRDDGFIHARIITSSRRLALTVPASCIVLLDNKPTVFVVGADRIAHAHPVTEGPRNGSLVEITSGLTAGQRVVSTGAYELTDGVHVRLSTDAVTTPAASKPAKDEG